METNDTDSILAYIFAALTNGSLLNDTYNYRTFHTAILEKFPSLGFKSGFDWEKPFIMPLSVNVATTII